MTSFAITLGAGLACGIAIGFAFTWLIMGRRADATQIALFQQRRHNTTLRELNTKLSQQCGHCGTSRALSAPSKAVDQ
ncbi:hypothetical protein AB0I72_19465 [Nocardiopsis sp. NPDC049922]|uniref:hypothetical protein n=1 Tax=Nocardiopsis sp. NPDC049922 TaxID=3155157 RepID=UPI0033D760AC